MYNHKEIEKKWQDAWEEAGIYNAKNNSGKPKKYVLIEFPYPSGEGLHMGHLRPFVAGDVYSRFYRMNGCEVLYPIGWDAFGLPAENFAIKKGVHPRISTAKNIENAKRQLKSWGTSFDWSREINTTDPEYYKWTQWIFLEFFKAGLAYEATGLINWCPKDKTGLANEEVIDGKCERCGTLVEKKELRQWYLKITDYAEKLLAGLEDLNWPEQVKLQQKNWIGKSEGAELIFRTVDLKHEITVFTTRPDTLFGATYLVLAPDHKLVEQITTPEQKESVERYVNAAKQKTDLERTAINKEKTGVFTGAYVTNPANNVKIPIWIADYVLSSYGTGAIMAVPAHDERDYEFAKNFNLPLLTVVKPEELEKPGLLKGVIESIENLGGNCWTGEGVLVNSGEFTGMQSSEAREKMALAFGTLKIQYKLRDWVFSRQRYWGEPIPLVHCKKCGVVPVPEDQLPVTLPEVEKYEPTGTAESPLAVISDWVNTKCPKCDGEAKRETNTMPQWAGSSWYWLRYTDHNNKKEFASKKLLKYWTPVDVYFGGMEHTTLHLLYSRFWNLLLYDRGHVLTKEPFTRRVPHGIVLASDGEKMSKSRGNVVNPDEILSKFGADTLRMYELFLGPHGDMVSWNDHGIMGVARFLDRVSKLEVSDVEDSSDIHKLIKKITFDIENIKFNTAIAGFMEYLNNHKQLSKHDLQVFLILLAPFAPHLTEEIWHAVKGNDSIHTQAWPVHDESKVVEDEFVLTIQVLGRVRGTLKVAKGKTEQEISELAKAEENVSRFLKGKTILKQIYIPDKLINFVIR